MTVKPTTPLLPQLALNPTKTSTAGSGKASTPTPTPTPTPAPAAWTWARILRVVRYVSLYYLATVIGLAVTHEGFVRLGAAGNVDLGARARATGVIAAGNVVRMVAAAAASARWPTLHHVIMLEFAAVTVVSALYFFDTIDFC